MDITRYNREAWNREVEKGKNEWTLPVSSAVIDEARQGRWQIILASWKPVPKNWFPELRGTKVLCLASGGGQQGPVLAAAGADVTVLDLSPRQLERDRQVAERDGLALRTVEGDMADLSMFADEAFDLIVHPVSNCYVPDVHRVWRGAFRVLRQGGALLSGFANPVVYIFDHDLGQQNILQARYTLPYSDDKDLEGEERRVYLEAGVPFEFSHNLDDLIGGQIEAGFAITGFYEDIYRPEAGDLVSRYFPPHMVTRAVKPARHGQYTKTVDGRTVINQGDVYWIPVEEPNAIEQGYPHPYVVIQDNMFNHSRIHHVVVCALTSNINQVNAPGNVLLEEGEANLPRQSVVVVSKISTIDKSALGGYVGSLSGPRIEQILAGIRFIQSITQRRQTDEEV